MRRLAVRYATTNSKGSRFLLIVGEKEQQEGQVSVRVQGEGDKGSMSQQEFAALVTESVKKEDEALNK